MTEIIGSVIGGLFALAGIAMQSKRNCICQQYENLIKPNQILTDIYEPNANMNLDKSKYIKVKNGVYKVKIPYGTKMNENSNDLGSVNIFKTFKKNYNEVNLEAVLSNINGKVELFVKRFDIDWNFVDIDPVNTLVANNGFNRFNIKSRIGKDNIVSEQIGIIIYSNKEENAKKTLICRNINYTTCNIKKANILY